MPSTSISKAEMSLTVAKCLELAYRRNEGLTAKLVRREGRLKLSVDHNGNATISGDGVGLAFSASNALNELGVAVKGITVLMSVDDEGKLQFSGSFRLGAFGQATVKGTIDVEKLLMTCSGILCKTARQIQSRSVQIDRQLNQALGY